MGTRSAEKREVRRKTAQSMARNYNSITVIDLKGGIGGTWASLCSRANDSHNLSTEALGCEG